MDKTAVKGRIGNFSPVEEESTEEPTEIGADFFPEEMRDKSLGEKVLPSLIRYGIPTGTAFIPAVGPLLGAGIEATSELTALELEDYYSRNAEEEPIKNQLAATRKHADNVLGAAGTGAVGYAAERFLLPKVLKGGAHVLRGGAKVLNKVRAKTLMPSLDDLHPDVRRVAGVVEHLGGNLLPDQVGAEGFRKFLMGTARNTIIGSKLIRKMDQWNEDIVQQGFKRMLDGTETYMSPRQYGEFLTNVMIGTKHTRFKGGELGFVGQVRNELYNEARRTMSPLKLKADSTDLLDFYRVNRKRDEVRTVFGEIADLLPKKKSKVNIDTQIAAAQGHPVPPAKNWKDIPIEDAIEIKRRLNKFLKGGQSNTPEARVAEHLVGKLKPYIDKALDTNTAAKTAYKNAESYYGATAERMENALMRELYAKMKKTPQAVVGQFQGKSGLDRYLTLKEAFSGTELSTLSAAQFDDVVKKPLQHYWAKLGVDNQGNFSGAKLEKLFGETSDTRSELVDNIFTPESRKAILDLASAMKLTQAKPSSNTVYIQLVQGGLITSGLIGGFASEEHKGSFYGTAAVVFLTPVALSRVLNSPRDIALLTQAIKEGPRSGAFTKAFTRFMVMNRMSEKEDMPKMESPEEVEFYTSPRNAPETPADETARAVPSYAAPYTGATQ